MCVIEESRVARISADSKVVQVLTMYSAHPIPLDSYTFPSAAHLYEAAHFVRATHLLAGCG